MSLKIITVDDSTDYGGTVISGSPRDDIGGKAIARLGVEVQRPRPYLFMGSMWSCAQSEKKLRTGDYEEIYIEPRWL